MEDRSIPPERVSELIESRTLVHPRVDHGHIVPPCTIVELDEEWPGDEPTVEVEDSTGFRSPIALSELVLWESEDEGDLLMEVERKYLYAGDVLLRKNVPGVVILWAEGERIRFLLYEGKVLSREDETPSRVLELWREHGWRLV